MTFHHCHPHGEHSAHDSKIFLMKGQTLGWSIHHPPPAPPSWQWFWNRTEYILRLISTVEHSPYNLIIINTNYLHLNLSRQTGQHLCWGRQWGFTSELYFRPWRTCLGKIYSYETIKVTRASNLMNSAGVGVSSSSSNPPSTLSRKFSSSKILIIILHFILFCLHLYDLMISFDILIQDPALFLLENLLK